MVDVLTLVVSIFGVIAAYIAILQRANEHKIEVIGERFYEPTKNSVL